MRRRNRINQIVADFGRKPLLECRVLDLGSLTGHFSAEFAVRGAKEVIGIEGRRTNVDEANRLFNRPNLKFFQDDVRNLSRENYGEFDIVLAPGILYHLDAPDCFKFLESISEVCTGFAVIDTHFAFQSKRQETYKGRVYHGATHIEYVREPTPEEQESRNWSSIGNTKSFWATKPSLINSIADVGFTSIYESQFPAWNDIPADRIALVALKNERERILAVSVEDESIFNERVDEVPKVPPSLSEKGYRPTLRSKVGDTLRRFGLR